MILLTIIARNVAGKKYFYAGEIRVHGPTSLVSFLINCNLVETLPQ